MKYKLTCWDSSNIKSEVEKTLEGLKDKINYSRITKNEFGVYVLWIDTVSRDKMWGGK